MEVDQTKLIQNSMTKKKSSFDDYSDEDVSQVEFKKPFDVEEVDSDESFIDLSVENQVSIDL